MKNYVDLLSDSEIKTIVLSYLRRVNYTLDVGDLDKIDDVVVRRNKDEDYTLEIYFSHREKMDIHDKKVENESDLMGRKAEYPYEIFYFDSFDISGDLYNCQACKLVYENDINDDLTKYWRKNLFAKFGNEYLEDLKEYCLNELEETYEQEKRKIENQTNDLKF